MKRLALNIDDLQVESFATDPSANLRGTVFARSVEDPSAAFSDCYSDCGSCDGRCNSIVTGECCGPHGTYNGATCLSTCYQRDCGCTRGDTCDYSCGFGPTCTAGCPTARIYPGCGA